jgi:manganese/zinc/iron transport system substrate-binding protein
LACLVLFLTVGCGPQNKGPIAERPIDVVTTTGMITDLVRNVGGERVSVIGLMGPGVDPHLYKASERDVIRLAEADVVFYNGLHLEGRMGRVFERMRGRVRTVAITDAIPRDQLLAEAEFEEGYDPHVWFDVTLWMKAVEIVRDTLAEMDPAHASIYHANAARYLAELADLHAYVQQRAKEVPPGPDGNRWLITAHDAFNYFGRRYGFEVRGLQGISTVAEAGTTDVQELAAFIADQRIRAIFVESSVPERNVRAVQEAVQARGFRVEIGGELFSDALGDAGTPEGTYTGMVRHNIDTIADALKPTAD